MNEQRIYPPDRVGPARRRVIHEALPDVLFVFHPEFHVWQVYRSYDGQWDAERLWRAIHTHVSHRRDPEWDWKRWRGAPQCLGHVPSLGTFVVDFLRAQRMDAYPGGRRQWIRDYEDAERAEDEARMRVISDFNHDAIYGGLYRHLRDYWRGDPLAGARKWVHTSPGVPA